MKNKSQYMSNNYFNRNAIIMEIDQVMLTRRNVNTQFVSPCPVTPPKKTTNKMIMLPLYLLSWLFDASYCAKPRN